MNINKNLIYCLQFLKNGGEKVRAIRLMIDATGMSLIEAKNYIESLHERIPLSNNRRRCWLCSKHNPNDFIEVVVKQETPGGKSCEPKMVEVHFSCWSGY